MTQAKDKRIEEGRKLLDQYEAAKEKHGQAQEAEQTDLFVWFINNRHHLFQRIEELEEALNDVSRFTPKMAENLANWIDGKAPHDVAQGALRRLADNLRRAAPLLEQPETDQDSLHVDETCKENRESFACSETGEREAAMDQLLKDDGELYDEKAKSWYSLGNALRGHIHGWFSSDEEAWDALRASFNERFPSDSGRAVYLTKELFIANSSAGYPDTPPQTHGDVERVARIIDPGAWSVMDAEKERFLRKYKGENIGYPEDQFRHKESMGKASAILSILAGHATPTEPVGYTNENQLRYVDAGDDGLFFPDSEKGCQIALYRDPPALSAMRPMSVDKEKLAEIRERHGSVANMADDEWDNRIYTIADDAFSDRAALLAMIGGPDAE